MEEQIYYVNRQHENANTFPTVSAALAHIPADFSGRVTILIAPGRYVEKITVNRPFVTLEGTGSSNNETVLSYGDYAAAEMPDGSKRGTFRSYSLLIDANDVTVKNLTVENTSDDSVTHGQAIALYADGDRLIFDSCRITGCQDTLFTGPLPEKELKPGGFIGPKQFSPRINGRQYYKNCYLCGDVDFIFGSATAYFENCTIESLRRFDDDSKIQGYVTAASTPKGQEYGYVFSRCSLISQNCPPASVYLGRPWRDFAKTVFLECSLGAHIRPEGFHDWDKTEARASVLYAEYRNYPESGAGDPSSADAQALCKNGRCTPFPNRADFVTELSAAEAAHFTKESVLDGWNP